MSRSFRIDFLGIGAEKAGTTWIADRLAVHPEIGIPSIKELFFFNAYDPHFLTNAHRTYERGLAWYAQQFREVSHKRLKGEISPTYLYCYTAAQRIKKDFPDVKLIVALRHPVERALSQYIHDKRLGVLLDISFKDALKKYSNYVEKGLYYTHLSMYAKIFGRENILIVLQEDILKNPENVLKDIYDFIGVQNSSFIPRDISERSNVAQETRFPFLNYLMLHTEYMLGRLRMQWLITALHTLGVRRFAMWIRDINSKPLSSYPSLDHETRSYLLQAFREDTEKLESWLGRDLSTWKR